MRITRFIKTVLQLPHTTVSSVVFSTQGIEAAVKPSLRVPRCSVCKQKARKIYDYYQGRRWRHLDFAGMMIHLTYTIRRVNCSQCGIHVEDVPWAETASWHTRPFEEHVAYLAQRCDRTTIQASMRIAWDTVGNIAHRVVARHRDKQPLDGLVHIGVDEIAYRRRHKYLTIVVDHERKAIIWAREGKDSATLNQFFDELGPERTAKLEAVTLDMSQAYIKAVTEASPQAKLIFDRYHVQKLAHDAVDAVRREEVNKVSRDDPDEARSLKGLRWPLHKNPWNLSAFEACRLAGLQHVNKPIYRAYLLKESLLAILDSRALLVARGKLEEWLSWASRSRLEPFVKLARTIRKYKEGILAYVKTRLSNGRVEGINRKIRVITRRAFGFHSASNLIAMLFLCCSGIQITPVHTYPNA